MVGKSKSGCRATIMKHGEENIVYYKESGGGGVCEHVGNGLGLGGGRL
jgi:hypothetical protein